MGNPARTPTTSINNVYTGATDEQSRLRESVIRIYSLFVAAGWTVPFSSDGTTGGAGDNWAAQVAGLGAGLETSAAPNGAYCLFQSPASYIDTGTVKVLVSINTGASPYRAVNITMTTGTITAGTATALPTTSTVFTAASSTATIYNDTGALYYHTHYTARGDVRFTVKLGGSNTFKTQFEVWSNIDGNGEGEGSRRVWLRHATSDTHCMTVTFYSVNYIKGLSSSGASAITVSNSSAPWILSTSWTGGLSGLTRTIMAAIDMGQNSASEGRSLGTWVDTYGVPDNLPFGTVDDSESAQTYRRVGVGAVAQYVSTAQFTAGPGFL